MPRDGGGGGIGVVSCDRMVSRLRNETNRRTMLMLMLHLRAGTWNNFSQEKVKDEQFRSSFPPSPPPFAFLLISSVLRSRGHSITGDSAFPFEVEKDRGVKQVFMINCHHDYESQGGMSCWSPEHSSQLHEGAVNHRDWALTVILTAL